MANDPNEQPSRSEVAAAVLAMIKARNALLPSETIRSFPKKVVLRHRDGSETAGPEVTPESFATSAANPRIGERPTREELEAAQEAALASFPENVRAAARLACQDFGGFMEGQRSSRLRQSDFARPSSTPANLPLRRESVEVPPLPPAGLDHPEVRVEWERAHCAAVEARFRLQPSVLRAYADAQLACERWDSEQRGRKPSGDLRHPVPRNRLQQITEEMTLQNKLSLARAEGVIRSIETGDVVGVEYFDADKQRPWIRVPMLVLQSTLDREAERQHSRANRSAKDTAADEAKWDEMVEELLAELPEKKPELVIPNLPELPTDREPTASEVAALDYAIRKHLRYVERGEQIEAKRKKDAATKVRTAAKREAEQANPEGTAAAKKAVHLNKAAERQRRWRERKNIDKDADR